MISATKNNIISFFRQLKAWNIFLLFTSLFLLYHAANVVHNSGINADEIEHLHSAWYVRNGYTPFVDFFQHHSPFFWYLLASLPGLADDNPEVVLQARMLMFLITILTAFFAGMCAVKIGRSRAHGFLTFLIIFSVLFYVEKGASVRPDGLYVLFSVISFYFFLDTLTGYPKPDNQQPESRVRRNLLLTSIFVAIAYLISPKAVFFYIFYTAYIALRVVQKKTGLRTFSLLLLILISPFLISVIYGIITGGLQEYLLSCYLLNLSKASISGKMKGLLPIFRDNWFFWVVSFAAFLYATVKRKEYPGLLATSILGITVLAGAYKSSYYPQYYLPVVPFFAVLSAVFLLKVAEQASKQWIRSLVVIIFACLYLWVPVANLEKAKNNNNNAKIEMMRYLTVSVSKNDCVYDEKRAFNIFRRDAHYLWYHPALRKRYIAMTGRYSGFNRCTIIHEQRPGAVDARRFDFSRCSAFESYQESRYEGFFLRTEERPVRPGP